MQKKLQNSKLLDGNSHQLSSEATDRENTHKNLRERISRLLTMESFKPEGKHSQSNSLFRLHQSGNLSLSATNFISHSKELVSSCIPTSRVGVQPMLRLSSGPSSHPTNRLATSGLTSPDTACAYQSNENLT